MRHFIGEAVIHGEICRRRRGLFRQDPTIEPSRECANTSVASRSGPDGDPTKYFFSMDLCEGCEECANDRGEQEHHYVDSAKASVEHNAIRYPWPGRE
jgi:hypothetical protein